MYGHRRMATMGTLYQSVCLYNSIAMPMLCYGWLWGLFKGAEGLICPKIVHILLALPELSPLFCPNLGGQLPPAPLMHTPMWCPDDTAHGQVSRHVSPPLGEPGHVSPAACEPCPSSGTARRLPPGPAPT